MAAIALPECYHGGAFFGAIGDEFDRLDRADDVISADVLDAWFAPSPKVTEALSAHLSWLVRTSPPTGCEGLVRTIARVRNVDERCILAGGGSSDLIFLGLTRWLSASSRVLILDPMYGEYAHVLERVVRCRVDRFVLSPEDDFDVNVVDLARTIARGRYDMVILVNPNSPTGRHCSAAEMQWLLDRVPSGTRVWVDETYIEYVGADESLESYAAGREDVVVCKSLSKVYALSGVRVGYLCASPALIDELRSFNPPWAVNLLGQVAAVQALNDREYYERQWSITHALRNSLAARLKGAGIDVLPGVANFLLCSLSPAMADTETVIARARHRGLFLRDVSNMGTQLGPRAVRIAVKDARTNERMLSILRDVAW